MLVRTDAMDNADEDTILYSLKSDNLSLKEVDLFQFILG